MIVHLFGLKIAIFRGIAIIGRWTLAFGPIPADSKFIKMLNHETSSSGYHHQILDYLKNHCNEEAIDMLKNVEISQLIDCSGRSLLHWSVKFGNVEMMQYFIEKQSNIDSQDNDGNTPLMLAVEAGEEYVMEALIEAGADVYIANKKGESPLKVVLASWILPGKRIVKIFLDRLRDDCGNDKQKLVNKLIHFKCPIYFAVLLRDAEITGMMLDRGCCIEASCHKVYDTALHEAVAQSDFANVKLLVNRGHIHYIHYINYEGQTPLGRYNVWTKDSEEKLQILKFLITKGAARLDSKKSPLERLFKEGREETVRTLLQIEGLDLRINYDKDRTALHLICMNQNPGMSEALRLFKGKDFDIHELDGYGNTALMIAASKGYIKKVERLLEMSGEVDWSHRIRTALCVALNSENGSETPENHEKIFDLLLQHATRIESRRGISFLEEVTIKTNFYVAESYLAWLAQMKTLGEYQVDYSTREEMRRVEKHEVYFGWCIRHLEEMKTFLVHGSITLLQLLVESQEQLNLYARDDEFVLRYNSTTIRSLESIPHYYSNKIQRRVATAIKTANLEKKAVGIICKMFGQSIDKRSVVFEVLNYLSEHDIQNLIDSS